ncbi:glutamate ABC transporter substrate-binding protein [Nocardioides sp. Bht2]|uniref:glutamate ABC transporter substrate-binding protein n=1 Tax=Nocardioides sp. Bht2 TaxID=3392297 RepID=UPI0039B3C439
MLRSRARLAIACTALLTAFAACGDAGDDDKGKDVDADTDAASQIEDGTRMAEIRDAGSITIGVKFDQPGLGFKSATSDVPTGFDVEVAKILASKLGLDTDQIKWEETVSDNREPFLEEKKVDLVLATYSITDDRRKIVGQAGPYMLTGQQLLVTADSDVESIADLKGKEVCSVTGSTSIDRINEQGAKGVGFASYSECVQKVLDGTVDGMSTDGSILAGYAAENEGELKVVGDEFSEERIGVGYNKQQTEWCEWINGALTAAFEDGSWAEAFDSTLGKSGVETPDPPTLDPCA